MLAFTHGHSLGAVICYRAQRAVDSGQLLTKLARSLLCCVPSACRLWVKLPPHLPVLVAGCSAMSGWPPAAALPAHSPACETIPL